MLRGLGMWERLLGGSGWSGENSDSYHALIPLLLIASALAPIWVVLRCPITGTARTRHADQRHAVREAEGHFSQGCPRTPSVMQRV